MYQHLYELFEQPEDEHQSDSDTLSDGLEERFAITVQPPESWNPNKRWKYPMVVRIYDNKGIKLKNLRVRLIIHFRLPGARSYIIEHQWRQFREYVMQNEKGEIKGRIWQAGFEGPSKHTNEEVPKGLLPDGTNALIEVQIGNILDSHFSIVGENSGKIFFSGGSDPEIKTQVRKVLAMTSRLTRIDRGVSNPERPVDPQELDAIEIWEKSNPIFESDTP
ncbi:hypothetical protein F5Y16DRAFT_405745 [Xylariaceae sp. FL0255]|nr:hypothetical protein F5Y16DRAFT_405745 [Xylariaceae sp. FL0255]